MTALRTGLALLSAVAYLAVPARARADATDQCIDESETGQRLFLERRFVEARPHLVACGRAACPVVVTRDCAERLRQAEASIASVVLSAKLSDGSDAPGVSVSVDGAASPVRPTGEAIELDPGPHEFRFERAGAASVTRRVNVAEGARLQSVSVTYPAPVVPRETAETEGWNGRKTLALVAGGTGLLGAAAGAVLGLMASSSLSSERAACSSASSCARYPQALGDYHDATRFATASTIAFVTGGALIAAGAVLWLTVPSGEPSPTSAVHFAPTLVPRGGGLTVAGSFDDP